MPDRPRIIVLEGDQTGQELLEQALRVLDPAVCGVPLEFEHYDLSLENRRRTGNEVVLAAARAMREAGLRDQGRDHHARGRRRRRQPEQDPARGGRRPGDHPRRPADPGCEPGRGRSPSDRGRAHGGRRRLRRRGAARGEDGDEVGVPDRARAPLGVPRGRRVLVPDRGPHACARVRRAEVDRQPGLRGHAQGGDGCGSRSGSRTCPTSRS